MDVTVIILSSTKCREVNKLRKPGTFAYAGDDIYAYELQANYEKRVALWKSAESSLREWEIEPRPECKCKNTGGWEDCDIPCDETVFFSSGDTCSAQILDNGKVKIIE